VRVGIPTLHDTTLTSAGVQALAYYGGTQILFGTLAFYFALL